MIGKEDILQAKILIVDDHESNVYLLEQMLRGAGYTAVTSTMDPFAVLELHRLHRYSLILLDLQMPGLDGFQIMESLKEIEKGGYLPVLVQTGLPNHRLQALKAGAKDFVSKPLDLAEVLARVHNMIEVRLLHAEAERRTEQAEKREEEIRASELNYRRLFETAQEGILILEAESGRVTDANPFLIKLLGLSSNEIIGHAFEKLRPFQNTDSIQELRNLLEKDGYVRFENLPLETTSGRKISVEFVAHVYAAGKTKLIQCNIHDVTEQKDAQEEILHLNQTLEQRVIDRTAELEDANKELQAFSYSVSHDLRAPLRHILGFVDLLKKKAGASLSEENQSYLTTIGDAAKRMGELIDNLLTFSRFGRASLQKTDVNLNELVAETLKDCQEETKRRNISWDIHPLARVKADRALLRMVLTNLISNAVKFTGTRPEPKIEIGWAPNGENETVTFIRDNGAGFNPRYTEKLFGVFQRLHSREEFEGTGIGLANVQRIIHRHGGRVWAEGVVDGGATFYFSIPKKGESE